MSGYRRISQREAARMCRRLRDAFHHGDKKLIATYTGDLNFAWLSERLRMIELFGCKAIMEQWNEWTEKPEVRLYALRVTQA